MKSSYIIQSDDLILVTGASGFIGTRVVDSLLTRGFRNLRCFTRPSSNITGLESIISRHSTKAQISLIKGNLLSNDDCLSAPENVSVIYHLAAGTGTKSFPDAFLNSVVTTRNLLDATLKGKCLRRFVNVSSFAVYTNQNKTKGRLLDESCPLEDKHALRYDAYCYAKIKQEEIVKYYGNKHGVPHVIMRPGVVYGPGRQGPPGRIGIGTFGIFLHFGGSNKIPLTYVDNCADAIVLAGLKSGIDGEIFNVVDDCLPTSREILRSYKKNVRRFQSLYVPKCAGYLLYYFWEKYSNWSQGQLPPVYNRRAWHAYWKKTEYNNEKVKRLLGWMPNVSMAEGLERYYKNCRELGN